MDEWSRQNRIPSVVHKATRNGCLRVYSTLIPATIISVVLLEPNMRIHVNGSIPIAHWNVDSFGEDLGADYAVVPDQSGLVLDWTPFIMQVGARCAYLGRFVCVDNDVAHRHLLQLDYELDVDQETRELIERDVICSRKYPPPVLQNVYITRDLSAAKKKKKHHAPLEPPSDPRFAYVWYWMGRELESQGNTEAARKAYLRRLENAGDPGDLWYTVYRMGDTSPEPSQATSLLLEAYNLQPRRREPLAALARRYADDSKYSLCMLFGLAALSLPFPTGPETGPHVETPIYEWMVADELTICLARLGRVKEAADLADKILSAVGLTTLSDEHRARIAENHLVWKTKSSPQNKNVNASA